MKTLCPHCAAQIEIAPNLAGQLVSCPNCQGTIEAPSATPVKIRKKQRNNNQGIIAGIVGVVAFAIIGILVATNSQTSERKEAKRVKETPLPSKPAVASTIDKSQDAAKNFVLKNLKFPHDSEIKNITSTTTKTGTAYRGQVVTPNDYGAKVTQEFICLIRKSDLQCEGCRIGEKIVTHSDYHLTLPSEPRGKVPDEQREYWAAKQEAEDRKNNPGIDAANEEAQRAVTLRNLAEEAAKKYVKVFIKHPHDSEFREIQLIEGSDGWVVAGLVKAPNAFGAMLTSSFRCQMNRDMECLSVSLDGVVVFTKPK